MAINQTIAEIRQFSIFPRWQTLPSWICDAHVWSTHKWHLVVFITLKIWLELKSSFDNMQLLIFCELGLKMPTHAPTIGVLPEQWGNWVPI